MITKLFIILSGFSLALAYQSNGADPKTKSWDQLPPAVQAAILANGGVKGQTADEETFKKDGKAVYEAPVKNKKGQVLDLVITEDGKLMETKDDDAADRAKEIADADAKNAASRKAAPAAPIFSHPRDITNPYLPLAYVKQDVLEGKEDNKPVRVERTMKPKIKKTFKVGKQTVESLVFEDRVYEDGKLAEVALDYFAQDDSGTVYYLGEDVDEYQDGKVSGHEGAWLYGVHTQKLGVLFPAVPRVGDKFRSEDVPPITTEDDEIIALSETVTVPAGTYQNCVKVKETLSDGKIEFKYYAPGVGVVKEVPQEGELLLKSHETKPLGK